MIFVSYRNGGHAGSVEAMTEQLRRRFGVRQVFLDVHSIPAGARYPDELRRRIEAAHVVLVVIHPGWSAAVDPQGHRQLDQPGDWVRLEVELALRLGKLVIQVLLDTTPLTPTELPQAIGDLANRQARPIRRGSFTEDVRRLADELSVLVSGLRPALLRRLLSRPALAGVAVVLVAAALTVAGLLVFQQNPDPPGSGPGGGERSTSEAYLADVDFVDMTTDLTSGSIGINGSTYDKSLIYNCPTICVAPRSSVEYDLGKRYRTLNVVAGVLANAFESQQVGHFEVYVDDKLKARVDASLREPQELRVDVTGGLRLRLVAYRDGTVTDVKMVLENQTMGVSNKLPSLAWGDPRVS